MANHLTPTELAREAGLERRDVIVKCVEMGVPIFNGRIDKTLFLSSLRETAVSQLRFKRRAPAPARTTGARARATACAAQAGVRARRGHRSPAAVIRRGPRRRLYCSADWRSSVEVVCSRILRQARVVSRSASKCLTTLRTRVAEISMPWRAQIRLKRW